MEKRDLARAVLDGDPSLPIGQLISAQIDDGGGATIDDLLEYPEDDGGTLVSRGEVTLADEVLDWAEVSVDPGGVPTQMRVYIARGLLGEDGDPLSLGVGSVGGADPFDSVLRDRVLACVRLGAIQQPEPATPLAAMATGHVQTKTLFGTLVTMTLAANWTGITPHESAYFSAPNGALRVRFLYGDPALAEIARLAPGAAPLRHGRAMPRRRKMPLRTAN